MQAQNKVNPTTEPPEGSGNTYLVKLSKCEQKTRQQFYTKYTLVDFQMNIHTIVLSTFEGLAKVIRKCCLLLTFNLALMVEWAMPGLDKNCQNSSD